MSASTDLVAFLRARLDEDEADARACPLGDWSYDLIPDGALGSADSWRAAHLAAKTSGTAWSILAYGVRTHDPDSTAVRHAARHDPARVLRDVAAARRVLDMWQDPDTIEDEINFAVSSADYQIATADAVDRIVRVMASVYADHPDYRAEWAV